MSEKSKKEVSFESKERKVEAKPMSGRLFPYLDKINRLEQKLQRVEEELASDRIKRFWLQSRALREIRSSRFVNLPT